MKKLKNESTYNFRHVWKHQINTRFFIKNNYTISLVRRVFNKNQPLTKPSYFRYFIISYINSVSERLVLNNEHNEIAFTIVKMPSGQTGYYLKTGVSAYARDSKS